MPRPDAPPTIDACYVLTRGEPEFDRRIVISADVYQDGGEWTDSELLILWTPETDELIARLNLDPEELVGCVEAIHEAHWNSEAEECRRARMRGAA